MLELEAAPPAFLLDALATILAADEPGLSTAGKVVVYGLTGLGCAIGVAGALYGARADLRRARGPHERAQVLRVSAAWLLGALVFVGLLWALPRPWSWLLWLPYGPLLVLGIRATNRAGERARARDAVEAAGHERLDSST